MTTAPPDPIAETPHQLTQDASSNSTPIKAPPPAEKRSLGQASPDFQQAARVYAAAVKLEHIRANTPLDEIELAEAWLAGHAAATVGVHVHQGSRVRTVASSYEASSNSTPKKLRSFSACPRCGLMNASPAHLCTADHDPSCAIRTSRDGWDADCTCGRA